MMEISEYESTKRLDSGVFERDEQGPQYTFEKICKQQFITYTVERTTKVADDEECKFDRNKPGVQGIYQYKCDRTRVSHEIDCQSVIVKIVLLTNNIHYFQCETSPKLQDFVYDVEKDDYVIPTLQQLNQVKLNLQDKDIENPTQLQV